MRKILEKIVRYYFKKYHKSSMYEVCIPTNFNIYECGDVLEVNSGKHLVKRDMALYLGNAEYFRLYEKV